MAIVEHCEQLKAELLSDKLTKRKVVHFFFDVTFSSCLATFSSAFIDSFCVLQEGFRHLNQILDSDALLRALDESTLRLLPTDKHLSGFRPL